MNLLFLDSVDADVYGGMEEWIRFVADGLASRGHRVTVAGRRGSRFLDRLQLQTNNVELMPLSISGDFHPGTIAGLTRVLKTGRIDVIIVNFNKDVRLGGLAARIAGRVRVLWSVGLDITRDSWVHRLLTPRLIDGVLVPSEYLKQRITRLGYVEPADVRVVPIGIPDTTVARSERARQRLRDAYRLPPDSTVAVTVGRFVEQKGHRYLLEAAAALVGMEPRLRFLWCGDGPGQAELQERVISLGLSDVVVFAGMLDSVEWELSGADFMIHPSIEEPFGIAVLEGMRAGLPIVASQVGGIPEVLADTGVLVTPRRSEAVVEGVRQLFNDTQTAAALGRAARRRFEERFSVDTMVTSVESCLRDIEHAERCHG